MKMAELPLENFRLPNDRRKWKSVCEQRRALASQLEARTRSGIVTGDVWELRVGFGVTPRTFFRRMAELRQLGIVRSVGRIGYSFDGLVGAVSGTNEGATTAR